MASGRCLKWITPVRVIVRGRVFVLYCDTTERILELDAKRLLKKLNRMIEKQTIECMLYG